MPLQSKATPTGTALARTGYDENNALWLVDLDRSHGPADNASVGYA